MVDSNKLMKNAKNHHCFFIENTVNKIIMIEFDLFNNLLNDYDIL